MWEYYHANGQLSKKGDFKFGKNEGLWEAFNKDGTVDIESAGTYENGVKISDPGTDARALRPHPFDKVTPK